MAASPYESLYQEDLYLLPSRTIIILDKDWNACTDEEKILLGKILGSVKLSLASVQLLHLERVSLNDLHSFNSKRIISFGVQVSPIQKLYEHVPIDGVQVIVADSLSALDDVRKKNLWLGLKQMFSL
jgi:hypothetical protein